MEFFEALERRRSIRRFKPDPFPEDLVRRALQAAILAPNSSNTQTWDFHWLKSDEAKKKGVEFCLNQSAARTASHLIVVTADPTQWKRSQSALIKWVEDCRAPTSVRLYYQKLIPLTYSWDALGILSALKWIALTVTGFFRPVVRRPISKTDIREVAIKSAALAAENFVLAISAQGGSTCMMEGFDECRMKRFLKLRRSARVVMVIAVGYESERGTWGPQFRLPLQDVLQVY